MRPKGVVDEEETSKIVIDGLVHIIRHTGRWKDILDLFGTCDRIERAVIDLYVEVLGFLMTAIHHHRNIALCTYLAAINF